MNYTDLLQAAKDLIVGCCPSRFRFGESAEVVKRLLDANGRKDQHLIVQMDGTRQAKAGIAAARVAIKSSVERRRKSNESRHLCGPDR